MPEEVTPVVETKEEKFYTQAELDSAVAAAQKTARGIGYNTGKRDTLAPFLEEIKSHPEFEAFTDFDSAMKEILPLAVSRKKNARQDADNDRKIRELTEAKTRAEVKYKKSRIDAEIAANAKGVTSPSQVAALLQHEFRFDVIDNGGVEEVHVIGADGNRMMKDMYTPITIEDVVNQFKEKNPHFVKAEAKVSLGTTSHTGSPGVATDLKKLAEKPAATWSKAEQDMAKKGLSDGTLVFNKQNVLVAVD